MAAADFDLDLLDELVVVGDASSEVDKVVVSKEVVVDSGGWVGDTALVVSSSWRFLTKTKWQDDEQQGVNGNDPRIRPVVRSIHDSYSAHTL